jgi:hypothetical protein
MAQETITIHIKPDKTVMQLDDTLKLEFWAKLDPGIGAQVLWNPGNGFPPEWGIVLSHDTTQFLMQVGPQPVKWLGFKPGPGIYFPTGFKSAPNGLGIGATGPGLYESDTLLFTISLKLKDPVPGTLSFGNYYSPYVSGPSLSVPSQPTPVPDWWTFVGEPLEIQVIPAPGVSALALVAGVALASRRRR